MYDFLDTFTTYSCTRVINEVCWIDSPCGMRTNDRLRVHAGPLMSTIDNYRCSRLPYPCTAAPHCRLRTHWRVACDYTCGYARVHAASSALWDFPPLFPLSIEKLSLVKIQTPTPGVEWSRTIQE